MPSDRIGPIRGLRSKNNTAMKHYIMIGAPISSVRTPPLLEAMLRELGVEARVRAEQVEANQLDVLFRRLETGTIDGLLVTMPHKRSIVGFLARQSEKSRRTGSANCVKHVPEIGWVGAQFDGVGLAHALKKRGIDLSTKDVLLVGAGGAGVAIGFEFAKRGCRRLDIYDIDQTAAEALAGKLDVASTGTDIGRRDRIDAGYGLYINATPVGMRTGDRSPIPLEFIDSSVVVADIVADPIDTQLAQVSRDRGATLVTGYEMVCGQVGPIAEYLLSPAVEQ